ncbi:MAG: hypothetical protein ACREJ3_14930 [Polyangiaceae bacterium]
MDRLIATKDSFEESDALVGEEVEVAVRAARLFDLLADSLDGFGGDRGVFEAAEEFEVSMVRGDGELSQGVQVDDVLSEAEVSGSGPLPSADAGESVFDGGALAQRAYVIGAPAPSLQPTIRVAIAWDDPCDRAIPSGREVGSTRVIAHLDGPIRSFV